LGLSRRRLEFLKALFEATCSSGGPVHYTAVADRLGVSKWTVYDMMRELQDDGLVSTSYSTEFSRFKGRSQVLFDVSRQGLKLLRSFETPVDFTDVDWKREEAMLLNKVDKAIKNNTDLKSLIAPYKEASPLAFCAALLAFLIVECKRRGHRLLALQTILEIGGDPNLTLILFLGALSGTLLGRNAFKSSVDLHSLIKRFTDEVSDMTDSRKGFLASFASLIINKLGAA
jgi:energy-coupling factor transport system substrate-specific component